MNVCVTYSKFYLFFQTQKKNMEHQFGNIFCIRFPVGPGHQPPIYINANHIVSIRKSEDYIKRDCTEITMVTGQAIDVSSEVNVVLFSLRALEDERKQEQEKKENMDKQLFSVLCPPEKLEEIEQQKEKERRVRMEAFQKVVNALDDKK